MLCMIECAEDTELLFECKINYGYAHYHDVCIYNVQQMILRAKLLDEFYVASALWQILKDSMNI